MSEQTTPRTPEQRPRGIAPGTPQGQRTRAQATNAPRRPGRRLNLDDENEDARRRRQQQFNRRLDDEAQEGQRRGDIVSSEPTVQPLMNVPELKL